jgi:hypothetical protein
MQPFLFNGQVNSDVPFLKYPILSGIESHAIDQAAGRELQAGKVESFVFCRGQERCGGSLESALHTALLRRRAGSEVSRRVADGSWR